MNFLHFQPLKTAIRVLGGLFCFASSLMSSGCALLSAAGKEATETIEASTQEVIVRMSMDKSAYRPGEAVLVQVHLTNTTEQPLRVRVLEAEAGPPNNLDGSITFWYGPEFNTRRIQRFPVISKLELENRRKGAEPTVEVGALQTISRPFLLTQMTGEEGRHVAQIHVSPFWQSDPLAKRIGKIFSNTVPFTVYGDVLYDRDNRGLIFEEEAINVAAARTPGDVLLTDAMLIEDDMGFYKWWINIDYREPNGNQQKTAYLVDAYQGRVWSRAKPFDPAQHPRNAKAPQPSTIPQRQPGILR